MLLKQEKGSFLVGLFFFFIDFLVFNRSRTTEVGCVITAVVGTTVNKA